MNDPIPADLSAFKGKLPGPFDFLIDEASGLALMRLPSESESYRIVTHPKSYVADVQAYGNGTNCITVRRRAKKP